MVGPARKIEDEAAANDVTALDDRSVSDPGPQTPRFRDLDDVPAAVVCALCGEADCAGCQDERSRSGVISIVAWERPGSFTSRLWLTARATTHNAESFFQAMPDGPIAPALRFAFASELIASAAMCALITACIAAAAPLWARDVILDGASRAIAARVMLAAIPGLAFLLVAAHAAHGFALDIGAKRSGVPEALGTRGLRFGLYAAGWDLVLGPVGFVVVAIQDGIRAAFGLAKIAMGLPTRSALAFLRGSYHLQSNTALPALRASYFAAVIATIACAAILLVAATLLVFGL